MTKYWNGFNEGREYSCTAIDFAAAVRKAGREVFCAETGALSGPVIEFRPGSSPAALRVDVRREGKSTWVLVRSRPVNPVACLDLWTAGATARLFRHLETTSVPREALSDRRIYLDLHRDEWPQDLRAACPSNQRRGPIFPVFWDRVAVALLLFLLFCVLVAIGFMALDAPFALVIEMLLLPLGFLGALVVVVLLARVFREPKIKAMLDGQVALKDNQTQSVDYPVGTTDPDPALDGSPFRWRAREGLFGEALAVSVKNGATLGLIAIVVVAATDWLALGLLIIPASWVFLYALLSGVAAVTVAAREAGQPWSLGAVLLHCLQRVPRLLAAQVVVGVPAVAAWLLCLVLAGSLLSLETASAAVLAGTLVVATAVFVVWWYLIHTLVPPIVFLEEPASLLAPLRRSRHLTLGQRGSILGALLLFGFIMFVVRLLVIPFLGPLAVAWAIVSPLGVSLIEFVLNTVPAILFSVFVFLIYMNCRILREGLDVRYKTTPLLPCRRAGGEEAIGPIGQTVHGRGIPVAERGDHA